MLEPSTLFLTLAGVFVIAFMKGSFGGGFAIIGIPLLALVMDPLTAGGRSRMVYVANLTMWRSLRNPSVEWETKAKIAT